MRRNARYLSSGDRPKLNALLRLREDSPSLKPYLGEAITHAYLNTKDLTVGETNLASATSPEPSPYSWREAINQQFYPGESDELLGEW
ncbi:MAG: hypothetical protein DCF25_07235 [Leptolyngbya foveolarum]|uniref:DUF29 domain-containing protein n=1 Tax=Leptolyngbya foveolarum TaxID=47253 RepID=A0A2W4WCA3_9CYAN|nr:MAG: hypothetical protein DCF25_07235 [Leptolyngbya foveolarum]